ncbi:MAG: zinc ribbon domain-containing protein, partial [Anaerolineae bacterium]
MIYCPNCGTANRDGSKFCNECGQRLTGAEGMRCPMCGALNRSGSVFCTQCGSRLIAVEAPAEPPAPPTPAGKEAVPEWLAKLREAAQREVSIGEEAEAPEQPEEEAPAAGPSEELPKAPVFVIEEGEAEWASPDWLSELRARGARAAEEAPAAPSEPLAEAPAAPVFAEEEALSEVPDWLQRLRAEVAAEEAPAPSPAKPIGAEAAGPALPEEAAPVFPAGPEEIPDWLKELGPPPSEHEVIPPAAGFIPGLAAEEEELPAWLREATGFGEAPAEAPAPAAEEEMAGEIPEWIMALRPGAQEPTIEIPPEGYEGDSYTEGILAGVQGLLPIELPVAKPPSPEDTGSLLESVPAEDEAVQIFRQVMESRPPARRVPKPSRPRIGRVRLLSALVLIAIMCLPLLAQGQWFTGTARAVPDPVNA